MLVQNENNSLDIVSKYCHIPNLLITNPAVKLLSTVYVTDDRKTNDTDTIFQPTNRRIDFSGSQIDVF